MASQYETPYFDNHSLGNLGIFPLEILLEIGEYSSTQTLGRLFRTNRYFHEIFTTPFYRRGAIVATENKSRHFNPAAFAIRNNHTSTLKKLLQHGLNGDTWIGLDKYERVSLLHLAIRPHLFKEQNDMTSAKLLLEHGADVNGTCKGYDTPLIFVLNLNIQNYRPWVDLLLKFGARKSINEGGQYSWRMSALHWAAEKGDVQLVKLFLDHGADIMMLDTPTKITAFMFAKRKKNHRVMDLLKSRGASESRRGCWYWSRD